jgi:polar amino acid transport system substrate-binding protein
MFRHLTRGVATAGALALGAALVGCQTVEPGAGAYVTDGKLTIATGEPAYYPYVVDDAPESGEGFEAAVAYAVAAELGFEADDVVWVRADPTEALAPGPKPFDFAVQQLTITPQREESVDFSSPYYAAGQAVITVEGSAAADATSIADLRGLLIGAATDTTSLAAVEQVVQPTAGVQEFPSDDDAKLALENGEVDAIVVDVPTAFYVTDVEIEGGLIVGTLPAIGGAADEWGLVLAQDSPLTDAVSAAVDALRENGTLDALAGEWLGAGESLPELTR